MAGRPSVAPAVLCAAALALAACPAGKSGGSSQDGTAYTLQVTRSGSGTVTSSPAGIDCGSVCSAAFPAGVTVTLTAAPGAGHEFSGWSGAGISCPGTGTCAVPMTAARSLTATFSPASASHYTLTVSKTGSGSVSSSPAGIDCGVTCSASFASGTSVTLTAAPANGFELAGWTGNGISCPGTGTCTVAMTATRNVMAMFQSANVGDLCNGLVTDKVAHPMTAVTKPAVGQAYRDPEFGTTVRRVSDAVARGVSVVKPVYSTIQAWNADESAFILYHTVGAGSGHALYDGRTYAFVKMLDINPADLEQVYWDSADPRILYYTDSATHRLYRFDVVTDTATLVRDFSAAPVSCTSSLSGGVDPMWTSWGSRVFGYSCGAKHFAYDLDADAVGSVVAISSGGNAPQPAPSGTLFFLNVNDSAAQVRGFNMNLLRTLSVDAAEHATLGTWDGADTHFSVQFGTPAGTVVAARMTDGTRRVIVGEATGYPYPPSGTHLSALAYLKPGWLSASVVGAVSGAGVLDQEVLLVNANTGGSVCRVAHHRSHGSAGPQGYWAEPHASISPRGTRILFASDWGGGTTVDTYVVELPGYQP